jgi:glycosyltransferase involved in cell wall biosynthesis
MKILLCNERFIFRYGVDRVLLVLGHGLIERGHEVSIMANNIDEGVVNKHFSKVIRVPVTVENYIDLEKSTLQWLQRNWKTCFSEQEWPDLVIIAGWPFISSIPFFRRTGHEVVFSDYGVVPLAGYGEPQLSILNEIKRQRKEFLGNASAVVGISNFITESQSRRDVGRRTKLYTALLGADHMDSQMWSAKSIKTATSDRAVITCEGLKRHENKIVLNLGRWEPGCYKNSHALIDIAKRIKCHGSDCKFLVLGQPGEVSFPEAYRDQIIPIGYPDDLALSWIMRNADAGITVSLWEGFNLPLAEMQWMGRPVLAFDIGAHPEVIADKQYLCKDEADMASKLNAILSGNKLSSISLQRSFDNFRKAFSWQASIDRHEDIFQRVAAHGRVDGPRLIIDVTNATKDPANSGVMRVTRRLSRELQSLCNIVFVAWESAQGCYVLPSRCEYRQLGSYNGSQNVDQRWTSAEDARIPLADVLDDIDDRPLWMLITETINERHAAELRSFARERSIKVASIFYDAIAILRPEFCNKDVVDNHAKYMLGLAECDLVVPISNFSEACLKEFWNQNDATGKSVVTNVLPSEFSGTQRNTQISSFPEGRKQFLCVSTLEPRKNHLKLIDACEILSRKYPTLDWSLMLVGNRYADADELAEKVSEASAKDSRIQWLGTVDDETLKSLYQASAFTIYPSIIEGFGMPIMESLWYGKPCICYGTGVMAELAHGGGCLAVDVTDASALADAIYNLSTDKQLYDQLARQAAKRELKTWREYSEEFVAILNRETYSSMSLHECGRNRVSLAKTNGALTWDDILYPDLISAGWQMNESEKLAITALLARIKPKCSIEVGTYKGGSLSLISQFSEMVFSIDIDPDVGKILKRTGAFENVSFLVGPSEAVLPALLRELADEGVSVDFVLIDGDHSAEGVLRDINSFLEYTPKSPVFMLVHDSFNPGCRSGMLQANWQQSPYVQWVDLDFIPGRLVEHGGGGAGELWGGLAMAYCSPLRRSGPIEIRCSQSKTFEIIKNSASSFASH